MASAEAIAGYVGAGLTAAMIAGAYAQSASESVRGRLRLRRARRRAQQAHLTAVAAAEDDEKFSPPRIEADVRVMLGLVERSWATSDSSVFGDRPDAEALTRWAREKQSRYGEGVGLKAIRRIDLLRVVNREGAQSDRAEVWLTLELQVGHGTDSFLVDRLTWRRATLEERWTLGCRDGEWALLEVSPDPRSDGSLSGALIAGGWADETRLRADAFHELAEADPRASAAHTWRCEDVPAAGRIRDLSVLDGRYATPFIEATLARIVDAWTDIAVAGVGPLRDVASDEAIELLAHPARAPKEHLRVRDLSLDRWEVAELEDTQAGPRLTIALQITGVRYVASRHNGRRLAGSDHHAHPIQLTWTLAGHPAQPAWTLIHTTDPAAEIPGVEPQPEPRKGLLAFLRALFR